MILRLMLACGIAGAVLGVPVVYYRVVYENEKRFREVTPGRFYRCGQLPADSLRAKLREHKIKLVINLQDEFPDPVLASGYWDSPHILESRICKDEGAKFEFLSWAGERGLLSRSDASPDRRPQVID